MVPIDSLREAAPNSTAVMSRGSPLYPGLACTSLSAQVVWRPDRRLARKGAFGSMKPALAYGPNSTLAPEGFSASLLSMSCSKGWPAVPGQVHQPGSCTCAGDHCGDPCAHHAEPQQHCHCGNVSTRLDQFRVGRFSSRGVHAKPSAKVLICDAMRLAFFPRETLSLAT